MKLQKFYLLALLVFGLSLTSRTARTQPSAEPKDPEQEAQLKLLANPTVESNDDLVKLFAAAGKNGKSVVILQVGNLEGCPPCQRLNKTLLESPLAKDSSVTITDFNYHKNTNLKSTGHSLNTYLHDKLSLPTSFQYPVVFLFYMKSGETWPDKFQMIESGNATLDHITKTIDRELKK